MTRRLDQRLVELGLAESRARARGLIEAGAVELDGRIAAKASAAAGPGSRVRLVGEPLPWVGRGALKLLHALDTFGLVPTGTALDLGASTGGFTEVLLARGAERVVALDVGHGQLHPRLAADPRVTVLEGTNARALSADVPPPDWITADLSFISLEKALPPALALARPGAVLVALIKPQFEAGPDAVGKGGIIRDPGVHAAVRARIRTFVEASGWTVLGETESPIEGGDGNREFLIAARRDP
ncbi:MAG TPA: TlyA family RNA methyltransferase [Thermohalobaculum sp.]|nr:TlyA family RNA methyltransferase [Thermohalobaculum sp.]